MKTQHLWVLGILLSSIILLALLGFFRKTREGFQNNLTGTGTATSNKVSSMTSSIDNMIRCPPGYTFFNSPNGDSLCCNGSIHPYTHQCQAPETGKNNICALSANVSDYRRMFKGENLKNCRDLAATQNSQQAADTCPASLPNFAPEDAENQKCCKNPVQIYGETGFTCSSEDFKSTDSYCIAKGVPKVNPVDGKPERLCSEKKAADLAVCPTAFQKVEYVMGDREAKAYDIEDLKGFTIPTCYRLNESCIPESIIKYSQARGAFTEYDPKTWEFSCSVWQRKNSGQIIGDLVKGYPGD